LQVSQPIAETAILTDRWRIGAAIRSQQVALFHVPGLPADW
jgi:hypothetical protein